MAENKENQKTMIYLLVAGMAVLVAWEPWRPAPFEQNAPLAVGTKVFPEFNDPLAAKSLEVIRFDEDTATIRPFKVAQVNGVWSIPSHNNYPADAREHMAEAATALLDLKILNLASESPGDQELYGVITPDPQKLKQGMVGVGTRVTLTDGKDKTLADLVIGKEVKDQPGLRYVRQADRDQIYVVAIKTDKLSTKFEDWIEKDLLKLNAFDVRQVALNDYSLEEGQTAQGGIGLRMHPRSKMSLAFDDAKSNWSLLEMTQYDQQGQPVETKLADDEELNAEKLNGLKTALDDLQIIDVERKPKGLSQDLRASDEFVKDNEARASLITRGFYPVPVKDVVEIFSSEGEATCTTKDGVKYVLRFGNLAGGDEGGEEAKPGDKPKSDPRLNRYLFVMAQFDESQIPKPTMQPMPGEEQPAEDKPAEETPAEEKPSDDKPAEEKPPEDKPADEKPAADDKPAEEAVPESKTADESGAEPAAKAEEAKADGEDAAEKKVAPPPAPLSPEEELKIAVQKENKRRQDEYNDAVKKGQDKVKELNDRFADWYFIISDDVYKKIHLGHDDVVKKKAAEGAEGAAGAEKPAGDLDINQLKQGLGTP